MHCQKISIPTLKNFIGNSKGKGVSKAKIFKIKYETKLEFPEGWGGDGVQTRKTLCVRGMDIF